MVYDRRKVMLNTCFFVLGIAAAFFILGLGFSALGVFFRSNQTLFARIGGVIVILFGLYQLGVFGTIGALAGERKLPISVEKAGMSPITALLMGFAFSFGWTPCVGPVLSSVLLMASTAKTSAAGFLLIGVYTFGFVLPFLAAGFFTTAILGFFGKHKNVVRYTAKIGGILLIIMGLMMVTGKMNSISSYLSEISGNSTKQEVTTQETTTILEEETTKSEETETTQSEETTTEQEAETEEETEEESEEAQVYAAPEFSLVDQYGVTHSIADYRGKVIFLNFWATWCPPCREEMPYIQQIYEEILESGREDVVILSVAGPGWGREVDTAGVAAFMEENGYTYPCLMDEEWTAMNDYYITAFPTTFMIDVDGNLYGYVTGGITKDIMWSIIEQTLER